MIPATRVVACALVLALAGCGDEKKSDTSAKAEGQILPGSTSDSMLPLDTVTSQPPLAPQTDGSGKPVGKASDSATEAVGEENSAPDAEVSPAAGTPPVKPAAE